MDFFGGTSSSIGDYSSIYDHFQGKPVFKLVQPASLSQWIIKLFDNSASHFEIDGCRRNNIFSSNQDVR